jgi:hypothetical protein
MVEMLFPAGVKNTCRRTVYGVSFVQSISTRQDLMAVMIYRKARNRLGTCSRPQCTPSHFSLAASLHPFTASRPPPNPPIPDRCATLASLALQSRPANHCPYSAASGCRPKQISTSVDSSSQSTDIKPLCSRQYPPAYEVTHSTPHRDTLKNSNVRSGALCTLL